MSANQTERQKLLERWAGLESERCAYNADGPRGDWIDVLVEGEWVAEPDQWTLLGALIEAVTARGWAYEVASDTDKQRTGHRATVSIPAKKRGESYRPYHAEMCATPADTLLAAYCSALDSVAGDGG